MTAALGPARGAWRAALIVALAAVAADCTSEPSPNQRHPTEPGVEALAAEDPEADARSAAANPAKGDVLVLGGTLTVDTGFPNSTLHAEDGPVEFFDSSARKFATAAKFAADRVGVTAVTLSKGPLKKDALLLGGFEGLANMDRPNAVLVIKGKSVPQAQVLDPDDGTSKNLSGKFSPGRVLQTETLLKNGKVLIAGGLNPNGQPLTSVVIFDHKTKLFEQGGGLLKPRAGHSATLLPDGRVLIAGGLTDGVGDTTPTAELYDPDTGLSVPTHNNMNAFSGIIISLAGHTATLIKGCKCDADGQVFISGGFSGFSFAQNGLESSTTAAMLFDPATALFHSVDVPQLNEEKAFHTATLLKDGRVLIAGGVFGQTQFSKTRISALYGGSLSGAEIYDPKKGRLTCVGGKKGEHCKPSMTNARGAHSATRIASGPLKDQVLLVGGIGSKAGPSHGFDAVLKTAELFDPDTAKFTAVGSMASSRVLPAMLAAE